MNKQFIIMTSVIILACFGHVIVIAATPYTITDLGTLGGNYSEAYGINNNGQVVGNSDGCAFLYDGTMKDLGVLAGELFSSVYGINDSGQFVGHIVCDWQVPLRNAFLSDGTTIKNIGIGTFSKATGINDSGLAVGDFYSNPEDRTSEAFLYDGTATRRLGTLAGSGGYWGLSSSAAGINNSSQVVGWSDTAGGSMHAFLYDGTMNDLGTLGGSDSIATGINNSSQVVGWSQITDNYYYHAFLYEGTSMSDLGTLGGNYSQAYGINERGQIVGESSLTGGAYHAFLYDACNMIDLNTFLPAGCNWVLTVARDINDSGQIVGTGYIDGQEHAFLMTPIPEPASLILLALGSLLIRKNNIRC